MSGTILAAIRREPKLQAVLMVCVVTGIVLIAALVAPETVGAPLTSTGLLLTAMTCIGAGLSAVALFPEDAQLRRDVQQGEST